MKHPVFVAGKSLICALGEDLEVIMDLVRRNRTRVDRISLSPVNPSEDRPYCRIQRRPQGDPGNLEAYFYEILFDTVSRTLADADLTPREVENLAIFFGSTSIDIPIYEYHYEKSDREALDHFSRSSYGYGAIVNETARHFGIRGPCYTFTTACTSSANALLYAAAMIEKGDLERALVIGYDLFNNTGFFGFESLRLMAAATYKPFDKHRDGIIMGEACGAVILSRKNKHVGDFRILGGANLCDTFNITTHDVEGGVIADVIRQALAYAGVIAGDIAAVKAHATGSEMNDRMEANGMKRVFTSGMPPVTGLKPYVGHTVGAAGVVELILFSEAVRRGFLPATPGFSVMDEELMIAPITQNIPMNSGIFMLNYFGFGGNCTSMLISNKD